MARTPVRSKEPEAMKGHHKEHHDSRRATPFSQMYWTKLEILLVTKARTCPSADFRQIVLDCQGCLLSSWHLNIDWSEDVQKFCILC